MVEKEKNREISDDAITPTTNDVNQLTKAQLQTEFKIFRICLGLR